MTTNYENLYEEIFLKIKENDKIIITEGVIKNGAAPQITRKKELLQTNSVKLTQKDAKKRQKRSTAS